MICEGVLGDILLSTNGGIIIIDRSDLYTLVLWSTVTFNEDDAVGVKMLISDVIEINYMWDHI